MIGLKLNADNYKKHLTLGTELVIVDNSGGHNYGDVGTKFYVTNRYYSLDPGGRSVYALTPMGNHLKFSEFRVLSTKTEYAQLEEAIKEMAIRRVAYKEAVDWMDEKGVDTLSPQKRSAIETKFKIKFYE